MAAKRAGLTQALALTERMRHLEDKAKPTVLKISTEEGYRPHFSKEFDQRYGPDSVFVLGVADCLTQRHVRIVSRAEGIAPELEALRLGPLGAREAIEDLALALSHRGIEKPIVRLLQIATGRAEPDLLEADIDSAFGVGAFAHWLTALENRNYVAAAAALVVH